MAEDSLADDYLTSASTQFKMICKDFLCFLYWNVFKSKKNEKFVYQEERIPVYKDGDVNQLHLDYETIIGAMRNQKDVLIFKAFSKYSYL